MISCPKCGTEVEGGDTCPRCGYSLPADLLAPGLALTSKILAGGCGFAALVLVCIDLGTSGGLGWSCIGIISAAALWILVGFPFLTYRSPALYLPIQGITALVYLWLLAWLVHGHWFFSLALPLTLVNLFIAGAVALLCVRSHRRGPNIAAYTLVGCALACLAIENILSLHFAGSWSVSWSGISAVAAVLTAMLLFGIQHRLRPAG